MLVILLGAVSLLTTFHSTIAEHEKLITTVRMNYNTIRVVVSLLVFFF